MHGDVNIKQNITSLWVQVGDSLLAGLDRVYKQLHDTNNETGNLLQMICDVADGSWDTAV